MNCIKLLKQIKECNFKVYRGIDINTNDMYMVYEWTIALEKNRIFESKKLEMCVNEVSLKNFI